MFGPDTEVQSLLAQLKRKGSTSWLSILSWKEEDEVIAHCLELDLAASGADLKGALHAVAESIVDQIEFAEKENMDIFHPAPQEFWQKLFEIHMNQVRQSILDHPPKSPGEVLKSLQPIHA